MKIRYLLLLMVITLVACQSEQQKKQSEIAHLEKSLEAKLQAPEAEKLIALYKSYREAYPNDLEQQAAYLYNEAKLRSRLEQYPAAAKILLDDLDTYRKTSQAPKLALLLASLYEEKLSDYESARSVYQITDRTFPNNKDIKAKLKSDWKPFDARMEDLRAQVFNENTGRVDDKAATAFMNSVEVFTSLIPDDAKAPELLFQAGDVAGALRNYEQSLALFERVNKEYPNYPKSAQVLFMRAFTLDADLKQFDKAKALYEEFLAKYPNDELAKSAQFSLDNLGKSEDEIIQGFLKKQQQSQ